MNRSATAILLAILSSLLAPQGVSAADLNRPIPIKPEHTRPAEIRIWDAELKELGRFSAFDAKAMSGGFLTAGDVNGDGKDELIVGSGQGREPEVKVFSADGSLIHSFLAYVPQFKGGVRVAAGDTDGDGKAEIVTAPGPGAPSKIYVYNADGSRKVAGEFVAYSKNFTGGVHVTVLDINGDGKAEIVTAPGPGGGPHIRIFNGQLVSLNMDFFAYDSGMTDGVTLSWIRSPQGPSLVTAVESWNVPLVKTYVLTPQLRLATEFLAFGIEKRHGVRPAAFDLDRDGHDEIIVTPNGSTEPVMRIFDRYGTLLRAALAYDKDYRGSLSIVQIRDTAGMPPRLALLPSFPVIMGHLEHEKFIDVNISQQRLYAYEHGRVAKTFLVSTGTYKYPTPLVKTEMKKKIPTMDYRWSYGKNHPDNYNLKNVRYNLNIYPHIYIHSAYWHNNFGHRMSHGCINLQFSTAQWIYNWADVGTPVETHN